MNNESNYKLSKLANWTLIILRLNLKLTIGLICLAGLLFIVFALFKDRNAMYTGFIPAYSIVWCAFPSLLIIPIMMLYHKVKSKFKWELFLKEIKLFSFYIVALLSYSGLSWLVIEFLNVRLI